MRLLTASPRLGGGSAGFTLIETTVALLVITLGMFAGFVALQGARKAGQTGQRQAQALSVAQQEIEKIRALPYGQIQLSSTPTPTTTGVAPGDPNQNNPLNPNYYLTVSGSTTELKIMKNYADLNSGTITDSYTPGPVLGLALGQNVAGVEPIVAAAGCSPCVSPETDGVAVGTTKANIYRFVTSRAEAAFTGVAGLGLLCPPTNASKRITVAVVPSSSANQAGPLRPVYVSTVIVNPTLPVPVGGQAVC